MKKLLVALMLLCLPFTSMAAEPKGQVIHVGVDGMVCDFCAQSLKKLFLKEEGVEALDVSLDDKLVTITMKPGGDIADDKINKLIDHAGYKATNIHRMKGEKHDM
jgi:copper chaperone CopZ